MLKIYRKLKKLIRDVNAWEQKGFFEKLDFISKSLLHKIACLYLEQAFKF